MAPQQQQANSHPATPAGDNSFLKNMTLFDSSDEEVSVILDRASADQTAVPELSVATPQPTSSESAEADVSVEVDAEEEDVEEESAEVSVQIFEVEFDDNEDENAEEYEEDKHGDITIASEGDEDEEEAHGLETEVLDLIEEEGESKLDPEIKTLYKDIKKKVEEESTAYDDISEHPSDAEAEANDALESQQVLDILADMDSKKTEKAQPKKSSSLASFLFNRKRKRSEEDESDDEQAAAAEVEPETKDEENVEPKAPVSDDSDAADAPTADARPTKRIRKAIGRLSTFAIGAAAGSVVTIAALIAAAPQQ